MVDRQPRTREDWELVRRSVAMLPPGAWALKREQSLQLLGDLLRQHAEAASAQESME